MHIFIAPTSSCICKSSSTVATFRTRVEYLPFSPSIRNGACYTDSGTALIFWDGRGRDDIRDRLAAVYNMNVCSHAYFLEQDT